MPAAQRQRVAQQISRSPLPLDNTTRPIAGWVADAVRLYPPPPPCPGDALRKNRPLVSRSNSRTTFFFTTVLGFSWFWWMQDSYSGVQDNIVLLWAPPSWGDPISQSQAHIPLKPLPPALDPFPEATSP